MKFLIGKNSSHSWFNWKWSWIN